MTSFFSTCKLPARNSIYHVQIPKKNWAKCLSNLEKVELEKFNSGKYPVHGEYYSVYIPDDESDIVITNTNYFQVSRDRDGIKEGIYYKKKDSIFNMKNAVTSITGLRPSGGKRKSHRRNKKTRRNRKTRKHHRKQNRKK
jgi:putative lipase involved disintegration of autophagic bodies